ncbi:DUF975 family protein [Papillibacter cinnamivorans]|uniref:Integral membrane protein n=1 Tax=Papillibacter cinnamivorans DSM 12816 TaxID=1122930 RepID=A0A1W2BI17_9FIRM|nr:DUF975 family protein [Papillibacter cinnamivorans]SMC72589.1 Protein of unknown function [Papillibacter cinnamivorans DSM 12816]
MGMNRIEMKWQAKDCMKRAEPKPMLMTLVYSLIPIAISLVVNALTGGLYWAEDIADPGLRGLVTLLNLLIALFNSVLMVGFLTYCLAGIESRTSSFAELFDGFNYAGRIIWLSFLVGLFTFLWFLLFIIPGFIAIYRYRLVYFLIIDNPDMTAMEAIRTSKRLMVGHKIDLFVLDLSFIGWMLLGVLTLGILYLWLIPYVNFTNAIFYRQLALEDSGRQDARR